MSEIPSDKVLPCGCLMRHAIEEGRKVMTYIPCSMGCTNYRYLLRLAQDEAVRVEHIEGP